MKERRNRNGPRRPAPGKNDGKEPQLLHRDSPIGCHRPRLAIPVHESAHRAAAPRRRGPPGAAADDAAAAGTGCSTRRGRGRHTARILHPGRRHGDAGRSDRKTQRVTIDTNAIAGSINLTGARFDDIRLKDYHETVDDSSPIITLFSPSDTKDGYFTELGYVAAQEVGGVPGPTTVWTLASGDKLTETTPVTLTYTNGKGVVFSRTVSIDEHYMISVADKVENPGQEAISFATYGRVTRNNKPAIPQSSLSMKVFWVFRAAMAA